MIIGVTGTRNGMNEIQKNNVTEFLRKSREELELEMFTLRHGDCVGVDDEVAKIAHNLGYVTFSHPPVNDTLRAFHESDFSASPKSHFSRNRDIVDNSDLLIVVPMDNERKSKGGTWYTYDYAVKKNVPVRVFYPDGRIES